jgi:hypothetical protein
MPKWQTFARGRIGARLRRRGVTSDETLHAAGHSGARTTRRLFLRNGLAGLAALMAEPADHCLQFRRSRQDQQRCRRHGRKQPQAPQQPRRDRTGRSRRLLYDKATANPVLSGIDNLAVTCCGDVLVAEDGDDMQVVAILADGTLKPLLQVEGTKARKSRGPRSILRERGCISARSGVQGTARRSR